MVRRHLRAGPDAEEDQGDGDHEKENLVPDAQAEDRNLRTRGRRR